MRSMARSSPLLGFGLDPDEVTDAVLDGNVKAMAMRGLTHRVQKVPCVCVCVCVRACASLHGHMYIHTRGFSFHDYAPRSQHCLTPHTHPLHGHTHNTRTRGYTHMSPPRPTPHAITCTRTRAYAHSYSWLFLRSRTDLKQNSTGRAGPPPRA